MMNQNETWERFEEGLKKASSRCRELGRAQKNNDWDKIAMLLDGLLRKGTILYKAKALSRDEILVQLDQRQKALKVD